MSMFFPADWQDADLEFHFDAGRLCLNFTATVGDRAHSAFDRWREPCDLTRWLAEAGIAPEGIEVDGHALAEARRLREAIYKIVQCHRGTKTAARSDINLINACAAMPPLSPRLSPDGRTGTWHAEKDFEAALSSIARDAIDLFTGNELERLRECAEETCSVLFIDTSRPGKRRWCSMNRCGNRSKKKTFRARQRKSG